MSAVPTASSPLPAPAGPALLTPEEALIWRSQQRHPLSAAYNICAVLEVEGAVDASTLQAAARTVIARHRRLCSTVRSDDDRLCWDDTGAEPVWRTLPIAASDIRAWMQGTGAATVRDEARRAFLPGEALHRLVYWDLGPAGGALQLTFHHCACDGLSLRLMIDAIICGYRDLVEDRFPAASERPVLPYQPLVTPQEAAAFWAPRLVAAKATPSFTGSPERPGATETGVLLQRICDVDLADVAAPTAKAAGVSMFALAVGGVAGALSRWSSQSRLAVGVPFSHRPPTEDTHVSYRVRTMPVRLEIAAGDTIQALVARVGQELREAALHADWGTGGDAPSGVSAGVGGSSVVVVNQLQPAGLLSHHRPPPIEAASLAWRPYLVHNGTAKFDLSIHVAVCDDGRLALSFECRTGSQARAEMEWLADLVAAAVTDAFTLAGDQSAAQLGQARAASPAVHAYGRSIAVSAQRVEGGFFAVAQDYPDALAVVEDHPGGARPVTYRQLAQASHLLAQHLTAQGVRAGHAVAVRLPRGAPLIAAVHGILRAEGVVVLIDPDLPQARTAYMLTDSRARIIIEQAAAAEPDTVTVLGQPLRLRVVNPAGEAISLVRPQDALEAAYVMYTSGSTGRPKGVAVGHDGIVNRLAWMQNAFPIGYGSVVLAKTPLSFDVCLWELLWPVMTGATMVTARHGRHGDAAYLCDVIDRYGVDTVHFVPTMLAAFLDTAAQRRFPSLRQVLTSGERLPLPLAHRADAQLGVRVHNLYGPTEASIDVTAWTFTPDDRRSFVPIGHPIDNITVQICDPDGRPAPMGAPGEIVVEGVGVALGYLGNGTLDRGRFAICPDTGQRTYRTGDRGRWREGNVLEFLGRLDDQIKINGQRVELAEIDAVLAEHPRVAAAATLYREGVSGPRRLQSFLLLRGDRAVTAQELHDHAAGKLPAYMVPTLFTAVEQLPHSSSGKLARTELADMSGRDLPWPAASSAQPPGRADAPVRAALRELLGVDEIPADVDLFHLGVDSITALDLVARLRRDGFVVEVADIFETRTVRALAARLQPAAEHPPATAAVVTPERDERWRGHRVQRRFPLSRLQIALVYHRDVSTDYLTYLTCYELDGLLEADLLRQALIVVADRHEAVRSVFDLSADGGPEQVVLDAVAVDLIEHDLTGLDEPAQQAALAQWRQQVRRQPFAWDTPSLFAFHLHRLAPHRAVLSIVEPFLDGWSVAVLGRDILDTYESAKGARDDSPLPATVHAPASPIPSAAVFAELERAATTDETTMAHWRSLISRPDVAWRLALAPAASDEPTTWHRHDHVLGGDDLRALRAAADALQVSLRTLLWAVHMRTVALFSGGRASGSSLMVNGRPECDGADAMCGLFLNIMPVIAEIGSATTWRDLVTQMVAAEQASWRHRRTPYAALRAMAPECEPTTVFNYTEFHRYRDLFHDQSRSLRIRHITALDQTYVDLTVQCSLDPTGRTLRMSVDHRAPAVAPADARRFLACLVHAARAAARDIDAPVNADRLPADEHARVLVAGRGPVRTWPQELSLARIVDGHAARHPDAVAVTDATESYTYAQLAALSCHYAAGISQRTTSAHPVVGVMAPRSARYWAAALAIWRAGGTYVPLSAHLPPQRLTQMIEQADIQVVLTDPRCSDAAASLPASVTHLNLDALPSHNVAQVQPQPPAECAYVLFTSGSTGRPKGARIGPAAMVNHWWSKVDLLGLDATCVVAQSAPASFDVSLWQFAVPWLRGGRIVVLDDDLLLDPARLFTELDERRVRLFETVPSHLAALLDAIDCGAVTWPRPDSALDWLMVTGEAVSAEVCARWLRAGGAAMVNAYGPTECADDITHKLIDTPDITGPIPIGRPIPNITCQVTDEDGHLVPLGVEGELRVHGDCLGLGYLDPDDEPGRFLRSGAPPHAMHTYRTGDRVRFTEQGDLLWLRRADEEVKVRGRRIELGDLETHLRSHPGVKDAAAAVIASGGGRLRAVIVPHTLPPEMDRQMLLKHLSARIPAWMLPDEITFTPALPLTPHGKLNRHRLAEAQFAPAAPPAAPPPPNGRADNTGPSEIAAIAAREWQQITGLQPGPGSDFFADGATSLDSVRLVARIGARLSLPLTVADLLNASRWDAFTAHLHALAAHPASTGAPTAQAAPIAGLISAVLPTPDDLLDLVPGGRLEAAAVGYLTPAAVARSGHPYKEVVEHLGGGPVLRRILRTPLGVVGHYLLPMLSDELFTAPQRLAALIGHASRHAHARGAARVALTGLIPAALNYGRDLHQAEVAVTTGHDVTAAAVVLNVARALRETGTDLAGHHLAVIGLGSVGRAVCELLLAVLGQPAEITLVEGPAAEHRLQEAHAAVRRSGYAGRVHHALSAPGAVAAQAYAASLVIGAANAAAVLDVGRLSAGTIVVDDSAPHLFDVPGAINRVQAAELHVTEGGVLQWPQPLQEMRWVPTDPIGADALAALRSYRPTPTTSMGCMVAALPALAGPAGGVIGPPTLDQTRAALRRLQETGFDGAPMMLDDTLLQAGKR
ncbi:amino acid adenylation domain-containing protein [Streptosporangium canum]|uniref:amino acid adenylation domain-containing protein n=1 Tax=Streptosporangium canum TaxID=324952 RepID=UPI00367621C4